MDCIFCQLIAKKIPAKIHYEDDQMLVFHDIQPVAPVHMLIVPKLHLASLNEATPEEIGLLGYIQFKAAELAAAMPELAKGYRLLTNCGEWGGQTVAHLHYHLIGGKLLSWSF
jgi:histidine triad (HIT) family protein